MKAILVGCGAMSAEWIRCSAELQIELSALVDINPAAAKQRATEFGLAVPVFDDFREAIRSVSADALFDCTIPAAHKEVSSAALGAGLHVLEEKPLEDRSREPEFRSQGKKGTGHDLSPIDGYNNLDLLDG